MRASTIFTLIILIPFFSNSQTSEHSFTTIGTIINIKEAEGFVGAIRLVVDVNGDKRDYIHYFKEVHENSYYINKKVEIKYSVNEMLKEVDMYANGKSVYFDRKKPKDISEVSKVEGILDIYDFGCAMPGKYFIKSKDSTVTTFRHYVKEKYQKPHEFKNVTVYYRTQINNMVLDLNFINEKEIKKEIPYTYICYVPKDKTEVPAVVWIGFNDFRSGAKIKYRNQEEIIDIAFDRDEFICDSCMYPTSYIYFSEMSEGKIIGEYKFIHAGYVYDLKYTRYSDNKSVYYYHDEKEKPFALTPCF